MTVNETKCLPLWRLHTTRSRQTQANKIIADGNNYQGENKETD